MHTFIMMIFWIMLTMLMVFVKVVPILSKFRNIHHIEIIKPLFDNTTNTCSYECHSDHLYCSEYSYCQ